MTTTADTPAETAFEAALAGRPVPLRAGGLAAFTEAVRATATRPGRPNPALAELLANGLVIDRAPSPKAADGRRRPLWFSTAATRFASAGAVAKTAAAAGIVVVGFTGAGTAGVLPAGVQHTFAHVVEAATPLRAPAPERAAETETSDTAPPTTTTGTSRTPARESAIETSPPAADPVPAGYDCAASEPFGACVSRHMHAPDGPLTPGRVDEWARYYRAHAADPRQPDPSRPQDTARTQEHGSGNPSVGDSPGQQAGRGHADTSRGADPARGDR